MADEALQPVEIKLDEPKPVETPVSPAPAPAAVKEPEPPFAKPEGVEVLKARLVEMEGRADLERRAREETERVARQREEELRHYRSEAERAQFDITDTRYQVIVNSIDAFRRDSE